MRHEQFQILGTILLLASIFFTLAGCRLLVGADEATIPSLVTESAPAAAFENQAALLAATIPERDLVDLARRLGGQHGEIARTLPTATDFSMGATAPFWYKNHETDEVEQIDARLAYRSDQLNLWVEAGADVDDSTLRAAAMVLEERILPTNRAFFGEEWRPGIDGDTRLNILHVRDIGGNVVGYFSAADEFVTVVNPYSNQREMFYINLKHAPVGSDDYYEVIAHEMQHMIHWHTDSNEATWLDEGLAVLAATLNNYTDTGYDQAYALQPDVQLNNFDYESEATGAHYGASYLFARYFLDRFGQEATQRLVRHPENGIQGINETLAEIDPSLTFDEIFADWLSATYLAGHGRGFGAYNYEQTTVPPVKPEVQVDRLPAGGLASVHQYGADYIAVTGDEAATFVFTGTQQVRLLESAAHSGDYFWTTVPADDSDMTLTGQFDLGGLAEATLTFWSWYEIEADWDYAYVTVSTDGGTTWALLETEYTTEENPQGNSYGPALTGTSGGGEKPIWVQQKADLTPYAGGPPILLRFEYVTDDAVHRQGLALDDIAIPELDYADDVESGVGRWEAAGFVRHSNLLPQSFLIQQILLGPEGVEVTRLPLAENQQGRWSLPLDAGYDQVILIVTGTAPVTTLRASYAYSVE